MKYINAEQLFPEELLIEIQKYVHGELVYIPKPKGQHKKWGENSGSRKQLLLRNAEIRSRFRAGDSIDQLADCFFLSSCSIKKIIYTKQQT
ncbi:hypothetical protein PCCS19_19610 [Paenibacillus sp. CCS19]|uniref:CD3324 family protein n=1 Tax=Paenibacillus sp. CCS19 TaxID=3158387 RepID=UPI0025607486|nr:CD3324 family protein [Paenibacillus cellulosilyticus]GMK38907.1 hypothetical protein PCCS19_19610 [Paenibacillus cellulosilyticus]